MKPFLEIDRNGFIITLSGTKFILDPLLNKGVLMDSDIKISIIIDDPGISRVDELHERFKVPLAAVSFFLGGTARLILFSRIIDLYECWKMITTRQILRKFGVSATWAVVPIYESRILRKKRDVIAQPLLVRLLRKYVGEGDSVIQHGYSHTHHQSPMYREEFYSEGHPVSRDKQNRLLSNGWQKLSEYFAALKVIQFPTWHADNNSIRLAIKQNYAAILAPNILKPQSILPKSINRATIFAGVVLIPQIDVSSPEQVIVELSKFKEVTLCIHHTNESQKETMRKILPLIKDNVVPLTYFLAK